MTASEKRLLETEAQALAAEQRVLQAKQSSSDLDIKVQQQKLKAEEYSMKIEQAQTCLAQLEERLKDSQQRFNDSEVLASNSEKKVQELEMKCDNLRRQLHDADVLLQERYDKAKEAEIQMEKRLAIIQCQFEETTKWVESTKKELEELKTECLDAERSKLKLTETVTSLNKDCNASKVKMETLSVIVHDLTVQKVKLEEAIKSLESRRSQMSDGIECIDIRVRKSQDDAENRTKQLSTSIEDQTIRLEDLKNLVIAKQNDCNELDGTRGKLKMECQMLEERYTILSSSVDQEIRRLKHATKSESADFLTGAVYDLESDMSKRLEALISQIEKLKLEKQQLTTNIHVMKSQSSQRSSMLE
jgi:chromosome segregation ATPase